VRVALIVHGGACPDKVTGVVMGACSIGSSVHTGMRCAETCAGKTSHLA
jgi:hypothetical protein